jgi:hypothetical protein
MVKARRKARSSPTKPATLAVAPWDLGATGPANRAGMVEEERPHIDLATGRKINPNGIRGRRRRPWVETYFSQGKIDAGQYATAIRLHAAYHGHPERDPIAAIGEPRSTGGTDPQVAALDRRREFYLMWARVPRSSRPVIEHCVLWDGPVRSMSGGANALVANMRRLCGGLDCVSFGVKG